MAVFKGFILSNILGDDDWICLAWPKPNLMKEKHNWWIEEVNSNTWQEGCFFSATVAAYVSYTHIVVPETHMVKQKSQDHNSLSLRWMFICPKCSKASAIYSWHLILMHDHGWKIMTPNYPLSPNSSPFHHLHQSHQHSLRPNPFLLHSILLAFVWEIPGLTQGVF